MVKSTRMTDAKVKMRDEARTSLDHMVKNLRMADSTNVAQMTYVANGVTNDWPAPANTFVDNLTFRRPIDSDGDGSPFEAGSTTVEWSDPVTFQLDSGDANNDGDVLQLVQLDSNGNFTRLLVDDISPVINRSGGGTPGPYDTPGTGGFGFRAVDNNTIHILIIQRNDLGSGLTLDVTDVDADNNPVNDDSVLLRHDDYVTVRN